MIMETKKIKAKCEIIEISIRGDLQETITITDQDNREPERRKQNKERSSSPTNQSRIHFSRIHTKR